MLFCKKNRNVNLNKKKKNKIKKSVRSCLFSVHEIRNKLIVII